MGAWCEQSSPSAVRILLVVAIRPAMWDDLPAVFDLLSARNRAVYGINDLEPEHLRIDWELPSFAVGADNWVAESAGAVVGYAALGAGCERVRVASTPDHDVTVGTWRDGRIGTLRGDRAGNKSFGGCVHREGANTWVDADAGLRPDVGLAAQVMAFFRGGPAPVSLDEMVEVVRFLEAANESRDNGGREVRL